LTTKEKYDEITKQVKSVIGEILKIDKERIELDSKIKEDLGADSLDLTTLLMALEDEFNEEISDEEAKTLITVRDTISFISKKIYR
jgi:acyl carrier protein